MRKLEAATTRPGRLKMRSQKGTEPSPKSTHIGRFSGRPHTAAPARSGVDSSGARSAPATTARQTTSFITGPLEGCSRRPRAVPAMSDANESRRDRPPEAGFAGREAHRGRERADSAAPGRLLTQPHRACARKEGVRGGTRGSPGGDAACPPKADRWKGSGGTGRFPQLPSLALIERRIDLRDLF